MLKLGDHVRDGLGWVVDFNGETQNACICLVKLSSLVRNIFFSNKYVSIFVLKS